MEEIGRQVKEPSLAYELNRHSLRLDKVRKTVEQQIIINEMNSVFGRGRLYEVTVTVGGRGSE